MANDAAIAPDKAALRPVGTATAANYTSYSRGNYGLLIDVNGLTLPLTIANFAFRVGNDDAPGVGQMVPCPQASMCALAPASVVRTVSR